MTKFACRINFMTGGEGGGLQIDFFFQKDFISTAKRLRPRLGGRGGDVSDAWRGHFNYFQGAAMEKTQNGGYIYQF